MAAASMAMLATFLAPILALAQDQPAPANQPVQTNQAPAAPKVKKPAKKLKKKQVAKKEAKKAIQQPAKQAPAQSSGPSVLLPPAQMK
jgi:hypothetical protein